MDGVYSVEYRQGDGWDQGFATDPNAPVSVRSQGGAVVLVHRFASTGSPVATLIENNAVASKGGRQAGNRVVLSNPGGLTVHVAVGSIDRNNSTATVVIGPGG